MSVSMFTIWKQLFLNLFKVYSYFCHPLPQKIGYNNIRVKENTTNSVFSSRPAARPECTRFKSGRQTILSLRYDIWRWIDIAYLFFIFFIPFIFIKIPQLFLRGCGIFISVPFIFLIQFFRELFKIYSFFLHPSPCKIRYTIITVKKQMDLKQNSWPAARPGSSGFKSGRQTIRSFRLIRMWIDIYSFCLFHFILSLL